MEMKKAFRGLDNRYICIVAWILKIHVLIRDFCVLCAFLWALTRNETWMGLRADIC